MFSNQQKYVAMIDSLRPLSEAVRIVGVGGREDGAAAGVRLEVVEGRLLAVAQHVARQRPEVQLLANLETCQFRVRNLLGADWIFNTEKSYF